MPLLRPGTFDAAIWSSVARDYAEMPDRFAPGDVVVDAGCHTGAFCALASLRGAPRVVAFEANAANAALARLNTRDLPGVEVRWAALWRSDRQVDTVRWRPAAIAGNTGGGSVLPLACDDEGGVAVPAVPLDAVLVELGRVRLLKLDVEGAEFPLLLTSRELARVQQILGEVHPRTAEQMAVLAPAARVGDAVYDLDCFLGLLQGAGFRTVWRPQASGNALFAAWRVRGLSGRDDAR